MQKMLGLLLIRESWQKAFFPSFHQLLTLKHLCIDLVKKSSAFGTDFLIIHSCLSGEPKRRKPNQLKPIEKQNGADTDVTQFQQPKKDRENFRKALVDIIM